MYVAAVHDYVRITGTAANGDCYSHCTTIFLYLNDKTMRNYAFILSTIDTGVRTFTCHRQHWFRCTLQLLLHRRRYCKDNYTLAKVFSLLLLLGGDIKSNPGPSKEWLRKQTKKQNYLLQRDKILEKQRLDYAENPEPND